MLSRIRDYFKAYGYWKEPFLNFEFLGRIDVKLVHETFFLKDYEINSSYYLLGKNVRDKTEAKKVFKNLTKSWKKVLSLPNDHYLTCIVVLFNSKEEFPIDNFYEEKFLLLGIRGKIVLVGGIQRENTLIFPKKIKSREAREFLNALKASIELSS